MQGTIIRWDENRGFGFVKEEITGTEIFIHISTLNIRNPPPEIGEEIEFETIFNEQKGKTEVQKAVYLDKNRKMVLELVKDTKKQYPRKHKNNNRKNYKTHNQYIQKEQSNFWLWITLILIVIIIGIFIIFFKR